MKTLILVLIIILIVISVAAFGVGCVGKKKTFPIIGIVTGMAVVALSVVMLAGFKGEESQPQTKAYISVTKYSNTSSKSQVARSVKNNTVIDSTNESGELDLSMKVYITKNGSKYHYSYTCGKAEYYECTLKQALERGLEPCKKCTE